MGGISPLFTMILFEKLKFTPEEFEFYIKDMDLSMSIINIVAALMYAQKQGVFSLNESEVIAKSIRVLENGDTNQKKQK